MQIALQLWLYSRRSRIRCPRCLRGCRPFYILNPLTAIVEGFRSSLVLFGRPPDWQLVGVSAAMIVALLVGAFVMFKRMDKYFADVI